MKKIILLLLSILLYVAAYPAPGKKQVRLVITRVSNFVSDITDVYLDLGDTSDFAFAEDGQKIIDTANNTPLIILLQPIMFLAFQIAMEVLLNLFLYR